MSEQPKRTHPGSAGRPIPDMVRCVVQDAEDKPPCGALVFVRDQEKHLVEMHTLTPAERKDPGRWYVTPENPKPRKSGKRFSVQKRLREVAEALGEPPTSWLAVECGGDGEDDEG